MLCESLCTRRLEAVATSVCTLCSTDNCKLPIEILSMSLRYFRPFRQVSDGSCQHCSPSFKFQKASETQDMEISAWKTGARSRSHLGGRGTDYTLSWKGQVDTAQGWPMTEQSWQLLSQIVICDNQKWQQYNSRWSCLNSAPQMSM